MHLRWLRNSAMLRSTVQRHAGGFRLVAVTPPEIAQGNIGVNYKISMGLCSSVVQRRVGVLRLALRRIAADAASRRGQSDATNVSRDHTRSINLFRRSRDACATSDWLRRLVASFAVRRKMKQTYRMNEHSRPLYRSSCSFEFLKNAAVIS